MMIFDGTHLAALYIGMIIGMIVGAAYGWMIAERMRKNDN
jgi:gas vesicle protein